MKALLLVAFLLGSLLAAGLHMSDNQDTLPSPFQILPTPLEADALGTGHKIHQPASEH